MGSFSWCYCDMGPIKEDTWFGHVELCPEREQRLVAYDTDHPASVLFPKEFGGKEAQINVPEYEDYGRFAGKDIYDLVAEWNREWIAKNPQWIPPSTMKKDASPVKPISARSWYPFFSDLSLTRTEVMEKWQEATKESRFTRRWRDIGIDIACYDEDNAELPYPIKIAKNPGSVYEECPPSLGDPEQGF